MVTSYDEVMCAPDGRPVDLGFGAVEDSRPGRSIEWKPQDATTQFLWSIITKKSTMAYSKKQLLRLAVLDAPAWEKCNVSELLFAHPDLSSERRQKPTLSVQFQYDKRQQ
jgi:hypothetical protein